MNHKGELRWRIKLANYLYASLISDSENNIYVIGGFSPANTVTKINDKGEIILQTSLGTIPTPEEMQRITIYSFKKPSNK